MAGETQREIVDDLSDATVREGLDNDGSTLRENMRGNPDDTVREGLQANDTVREQGYAYGDGTSYEANADAVDVAAGESDSAHGARTELEDTGVMAGATVLDSGAGNAPATELDQGKAVQPVHSRINLPPEVEERYRLLRDNPKQGSEADSAILEDRQSGRIVFFKYYRRNIRPDLNAMSKLQRADRAHIVEIVEYHDDLNGTWEIQEYCELGSLKDWVESKGMPLDDGLLLEIVRELAEALRYLRGEYIAHRDLKPANILVRTDDPLDLVLTDFGLAKSNQALTHVTQHVQGTWLYAAPEVYSRESTIKSDWFSFGAIIFELKTGRPLFSDENGRPLPDEVARDRCTHGIYTTAPVEDERWLDLLDGLLTYSRNDRWGDKQVREWLEGGSPKVLERHEASRSGSAGARPMSYKPEWLDRLVTTPSELAEAFRVNWSRAVASIAGREREEILTFLEGFAGCEQAVAILKANAYSPEAKIVKLQMTLDEGTTVQFRGRDITEDVLKSVVSAAHGGDAESLGWLEALVDNRILKAYGEGCGDETSVRVDAYLYKWKQQVEDVASIAPPNRAVRAHEAFRNKLPELVGEAFSLVRRQR